MKTQRKYPILQTDFKRLREENYLYIDKTEDIFNIATELSYPFLARPRRFGKTLTVSTFKYLFQGEKELFKDLWIYDKWDWEKKSPVLLLDYSDIFDIDEPLEESLSRCLDEYAKEWGVSLEDKHYSWKLKTLIEHISTTVGRVVILIDNHDFPIVKLLENDYEKAVHNKQVLSNLYSCIKDADGHIRFFFMTGVTRYYQDYFDSNLNNLSYLTLNAKNAAMCGITQEELETVFADEIEEFAEKAGKTRTELLDELKTWYGGFRFSHASTTVYDPYAIIEAISSKRLVPSSASVVSHDYLIDLIKSSKVDVRELDNSILTYLDLGALHIERIYPETMLYLSGYLTILDYNERYYTVGYPNRIVKDAFEISLLNVYTKPHSMPLYHLLNMKMGLRKNDISMFISDFKEMLNIVAYGSAPNHEEHYGRFFFLVFKFLGYKTDGELNSVNGRIDAMVETKTHFFIFELQLDKPAAKALSQMEDKRYYEKYSGGDKPVVCIGVSISTEGRNINDWAIMTVE